MTSTSPSDTFDPLPPGMSDWIKDSTGARIVSLTPVAGGGVSREGCHVVLEGVSGHQSAYLAYDTRRVGDPTRTKFARREMSALQLAGKFGIRVPAVIAASADRLAILMERMEGDPRFAALKTLTDRRQIAEDYIGEIVRLHRIDASAAALDGFEPFAPAQRIVAERISELRTRHAEGIQDPLLVFCYDWLEKNIPRGKVPTVVVHGDAGPANFLHDGKRVTAILDWEQSHLGDPMEDLAWICIRTALSSFVPLTPLFKEYERRGGYPVDLDRVRYFRIYNQAGVLTDMHASLFQSSGKFLGVLGNVFIYYLVHLRLMIEGIAELERISLTPPPLPASPSSPAIRLFDIALEDVRNNVAPHLPNPVGAHRLKALVRMVKYWQGRERWGIAFDAAEIEDIADALGRSFTSLANARAALVEAIKTGVLGNPRLVDLSYRRAMRETEIGRSALGAFAERHYEPL